MTRKIIKLDAGSIISAAKAEIIVKNVAGGTRKISGLDVFNVTACEPEIEIHVPRVIADFECLGGCFDERGKWQQFDHGMTNLLNYPKIQAFLTAAMNGSSGIKLIETAICKESFVALLKLPRNHLALNEYRKGEGKNKGERALEEMAWSADAFPFIVSDDDIFYGITELKNRNGFPVSLYKTRGFMGAVEAAFGYDLEDKFEEILGILVKFSEIKELFSRIPDNSHGNLTRPRSLFGSQDWEIEYSRRRTYTAATGDIRSPLLSDCLRQLSSAEPIRPNDYEVFTPKITAEGVKDELSLDFLRQALARDGEEEVVKRRVTAPLDATSERSKKEKDPEGGLSLDFLREALRKDREKRR